MCVCCCSIVVFVVIMLVTKAASNDFLTHLETFYLSSKFICSNWKFFLFFFHFFSFFFHFSPLIVHYSVNLPILPFWNNKNNYEIFFLCFSALPEINPIYDIHICNCVHIFFYYTFWFIVHPYFLQCCIFVLYLPVHIPVFLVDARRFLLYDI